MDRFTGRTERLFSTGSPEVQNKTLRPQGRCTYGAAPCAEAGATRRELGGKDLQCSGCTRGIVTNYREGGGNIFYVHGDEPIGKLSQIPSAEMCSSYLNLNRTFLRRCSSQRNTATFKPLQSFMYVIATTCRRYYLIGWRQVMWTRAFGSNKEFILNFHLIISLKATWFTVVNLPYDNAEAGHALLTTDLLMFEG